MTCLVPRKYTTDGRAVSCNGVMFMPNFTNISWFKMFKWTHTHTFTHTQQYADHAMRNFCENGPKGWEHGIYATHFRFVDDTE